MRLFSLPDNTIDKKDRAQWVTPPFDLQFNEIILVTLTKDSTFLWNTRSSVSKDVGYYWNVRENIIKDNQYLWNTLSSVNKDFSILWNVRQQVIHDNSYLWNVRTSLSTDLSILWNTGARITKDLQIIWNTDGTGIYFPYGVILYVRNKQEVPLFIKFKEGFTLNI